MNFKDFFLLRERQHFIDLARFTEIVISKLEDQIRKKKNGVRSGDTFTVPLTKQLFKLDPKFWKGYDLDFKFYKEYSRRTRNSFKNVISGEHGIKGAYYEQLGGTNGTIEIYLNTTKSSEYYYKDKKFEDIIDGSLPKFVKDVIRHELSHAYEDIVKNISKFQTSDSDKITDSKYRNLDEEINADLNQFLNSELSVNADIMYKISEGDINGAVNAYIRKLKTSEFIKQVTPQNKIWIIKTIYTFVRDLVEQGKAELPS